LTYKPLNIVGRTPQAIEAFHTREYSLFISQIGFANPGQMKVIFDSSESLSTISNSLQPILLAGKGKISSLEGRYHQAQNYFKEAFTLARKELKSSKGSVMGNVLAYVHYEYGAFFKHLYAPDNATEQFRLAAVLNSSAKLKPLIDFQLELVSIESEAKTSLNRLERLVDKFRVADYQIMYVLGLHRLGILSRLRRKHDQAERYYNEALFLAEEGDFQYLSWTIKNSIGLLLHKQGKFAQAVTHFESFVDKIESHYLKTIVMKNLALRYRVMDRPDDAIELSRDALEYAQSYGVFSEVPDLALLVGRLIRDYSDKPKEAFHYFKLGYDTSMEQKKVGLPISGPRLRAVEGYAKYLEAQLPDSFQSITVANYFEWAKGKSWVKIQDLFHYNLFVYHFIHTGIGQKTFKHLDMISTTFYSLAKRMRDLRGISFPDLKDADMVLPPDLYLEPLQRYVQLHRDKTLKQANAQFEHDIYEYLFKESGYNKKLLARSLDLSYSVVLKNTKQFTQASETFTQPQLEAPR
jgi:tetratricopeptide (TPR) repeat protein